MLFLYIDLTATKEGILRSRASLLTGPFLNKGNLSGKKDGTFRHFYFLAVSFSSLKRASSSVFLSAMMFLRAWLGTAVRCASGRPVTGDSEENTVEARPRLGAQGGGGGKCARDVRGRGFRGQCLFR